MTLFQKSTSIPHFISILQTALLTVIFLFSVWSRSNNFATIPIQKKKKKRKEKRYLKGKKFCWKKFLRKIFSRLSSKTFHLIFYYFYPLLAPSSSCAPPPSYMIRRNFHPNLLISIFRVNLRIQSEYEKYEPKKTPNSNSFHAVMNQRVITCFN